MNYEEAKVVNGATFCCYSGSKAGTTAGRPSAVGSYRTVANGTLRRFTVSTAQVGDIITHDGARYVVRVNDYDEGNAWIPGVYRFAATPADEGGRDGES